MSYMCLWDLSGRGTARAEDAQGTPTQSHISPSILVYEDIPGYTSVRRTFARRAARRRQQGSDLKRFRGGLAFKAHRLLYHSTLGLGVIKKKKMRTWGGVWGFPNAPTPEASGVGFRVSVSGLKVQDSKVEGLRKQQQQQREVPPPLGGFRVQGSGFRV